MPTLQQLLDKRLTAVFFHGQNPISWILLGPSVLMPKGTGMEPGHKIMRFYPTQVLSMRTGLNAFVSYGVHYRLRNSVVHSRKKSQDESEQLRAISGNNGIVSGVGFSVIYNSTNHPLRPTNGFRSRIDGEFVGLGGDSHFFSFSYVNSAYQPFGSNGVLKLRADFKFIQPLDTINSKMDQKTSLDTIPLDERLMLGGDYQVRGFRPYAIGPKFNNLP